MSYLEMYDYNYLSADDIAKQLDSKNFNNVRLKAGKEFFIRMQKNVENKNNILIESTLSGIYLKRMIPGFQRNKYSVSIVFVFVDSVSVCLNRIKERILKGGHNVPDEDVIRRFKKSNDNFWNYYRNIADDWYLYSNSEDDIKEVAFGFGNDYEIINEELFRIFAQLIK